VLGDNFEAVNISSLMLDSDSGQTWPQNQGPDYGGDGDVDGTDLREYANRLQLGAATLTMGQFALDFGKMLFPSLEMFKKEQLGFS
jgi:hypothetical protein